SELAAVDEAIAALRLGRAEGTVTSAKDARQAIMQISTTQVNVRAAAAAARPAPPALRIAMLRPMDTPVPWPTGTSPSAGPVPVPSPVPMPAPGPGSGSQAPTAQNPLPLIPELRDLFAALETGVFLLPRKSWTGTIELVPFRPLEEAD